MDLVAWNENLKREDDLLIGELNLSFLGVSTKVEVCFIQKESSPSPIQLETLNGYLNNSESIHSVVAEAIYVEYRASLLNYRRAIVSWGENPDELAPIISDKCELAPLLIYQTLFIQDSEVPGEFGMGFWSKWEQEHGLGVKFVGWELGQLDENSIHYQ